MHECQGSRFLQGQKTIRVSDTRGLLMATCCLDSTTWRVGGRTGPCGEEKDILGMSFDLDIWIWMWRSIHLLHTGATGGIYLVSGGIRAGGDSAITAGHFPHGWR